ncbi:wurstfest [Carabus blaptoides fortunei]
MLQDKESNDEIPSPKKELLMMTSQECEQRSQSDNTNIGEDPPSRNNVNLEGTVPLHNTPWRHRALPRTIRRQNPLNVSTELMTTRQECEQRSQSDNTNTGEDPPSRNNVNLEGTVPLHNTPWRHRALPRTIRRQNPLNETRGEEPLGFGVTTGGIIRLCLHDNIRVDMTLDRAIRVMNYNNNIAVAVSASGSTAALLHPNGKRLPVWITCGDISIRQTHLTEITSKYAKMWYKGVSFTSDQSAVVYLVDSAGTRTTTDTFSDLSEDFSHPVFYNESVHGPAHVEDAKGLLQQSKYWISKEGTDNWIINQVRVSQTVDGLVRIDRNNGQYNLRTSPSNGSAGISTPFVHCTGSSGEAGHLFVRRGERRMHYSGNTFIVRNAGHSAGFDDNELKIY